MNVKIYLLFFLMLGVLAILVNFDSSSFFSGSETIRLNESAELNAQGDSARGKGLESEKKDDGHGYDAHNQNTASSRQAVSLSDSEVSLGESRDAPVEDPALEELALCDEEFMDEESYYLQEEILAIEEEQNLYTPSEQETKTTEEEQDALERSIIETSIAVGSLPPDPEEELFCDDEILQEDEAINEGSG